MPNRRPPKTRRSSQPLQETEGGSPNTPRALTLHLRPEAAEAERVIAIGTDPAAILEESRLDTARNTRATKRPVETTTGGG
jgi:hypothetical protein